MDDLQEDVARADFADDVTGARRAIDAHADISKRLSKVPVDELEAQGKFPGISQFAYYLGTPLIGLLIGIYMYHKTMLHNYAINGQECIIVHTS